MKPLKRPKGKSAMEIMITGARLLFPFSQLLRCNDIDLWSTALVRAWVKHIFPGLPHDFPGSMLKSINARVPALIRMRVPSAEYTSASTVERRYPFFSELLILVVSDTRSITGVSCSSRSLRFIVDIAIDSNGWHKESAAIITQAIMLLNNLFFDFIGLDLLIGQSIV